MEPEETPVNRLKPLNDFAFQKIIEEVVKMDAGIQRAQEKMDMIQRDPVLLHAYQMYELTLFDEASRLYGARLEGRQEGKLEVARIMKLEN